MKPKLKLRSTVIKIIKGDYVGHIADVQSEDWFQNKIKIKLRKPPADVRGTINIKYEECVFVREV
jgi:hypothetical protein